VQALFFAFGFAVDKFAIWLHCPAGRLPPPPPRMHGVGATSMRTKIKSSGRKEKDSLLLLLPGKPPYDEHQGKSDHGLSGAKPADRAINIKQLLRLSRHGNRFVVRKIIPPRKEGARDRLSLTVADGRIHMFLQSGRTIVQSPISGLEAMQLLVMLMREIDRLRDSLQLPETEPQFSLHTRSLQCRDSIRWLGPIPFKSFRSADVQLQGQR
jgi:hypothetical protein